MSLRDAQTDRPLARVPPRLPPAEPAGAGRGRPLHSARPARLPGRRCSTAASPRWTKAASCASATTTTCTSRSRSRSSRSDPPKTRTVYLFGGSGTMECFVSEASLAAAIGRDARQPIQVVSLAAHQESMAHDAGARRQPAAGPCHAGHRAGAHPRDRQALSATRPCSSGHTLLVRSKRLDADRAEVLRPQGRPTRAPSPASSTTSARTCANGRRARRRGAPRSPTRSHYYPWGATGHLPLGKRRNVLYVLAKDVTLYRKYADYNFAMLEEILKLARERGYDVVLYDQPLNASAAGPDWNGVVPAYHSARPGARAAVRRALRAHRAPRRAPGRRLRRPLPPARAGAPQVAAGDGARAGLDPAPSPASSRWRSVRRADRRSAAMTGGATRSAAAAPRCRPAGRSRSPALRAACAGRAASGRRAAAARP